MIDIPCSGAYCNDVIVGSREWNGIYTDIPVMGSDGYENTIDYCLEGDVPSFKLYDLSDNNMYNLSVDYTPHWENNEIFFINSLSIVHSIPDVFSLNKPYPNPFNPATSIDFSIPIETHLSIIIYDIKGQQIEILLDKIIEPGYHTIKWNTSYIGI